MRRIMTILACLAVVPAGGAWADDDCQVPMANWQPRAALEQVAAAQGWTVRAIGIDDGCYEIDGRDAQGRRIEVKLDPATLEVIEIEYEEEDDDDDAEDRQAPGPPAEPGTPEPDDE
jgi:hypothetical protein